MEIQVCARCGNVGNPQEHTKGHILIELLLWLMIIVPGLIYSVWRHSSKTAKCPACGSFELIPLLSPAGRELCSKYGTMTKDEIDSYQYSIANPSIFKKIIKYKWVIILGLLFGFPFIAMLIVKVIG